jgi:hypothetical protein
LKELWLIACSFKAKPVDTVTCIFMAAVLFADFLSAKSRLFKKTRFFFSHSPSQRKKKTPDEAFRKKNFLKKLHFFVTLNLEELCKPENEVDGERERWRTKENGGKTVLLL